MVTLVAVLVSVGVVVAAMVLGVKDLESEGPAFAIGSKLV